MTEINVPKDKQVMETLVEHNRLDVAGGGLFPCAGVYAVTQSTGTIHAGAPVT